MEVITSSLPLNDIESGENESEPEENNQRSSFNIDGKYANRFGREISPFEIYGE